MTDENPGAPAPAPQSSSEAMIPKHRLDEALAKARVADEQARFWQQTAQQFVQGQNRGPQPPQQEPEYLRKLKEENPEAYKIEIRRLRDAAQSRSALLDLHERTDQNSFLLRYGKQGEKRLNEVESTLQQFRAAGHMNVDRNYVFHWILGQEKLREEAAAHGAPAPAPAAPAPKPVQTAQAQDGDIPSSDAAQATTLGGGKAPTSAGVKTRDERIKDLENVEF